MNGTVNGHNGTHISKPLTVEEIQSEIHSISVVSNSQKRHVKRIKNYGYSREVTESLIDFYGFSQFGGGTDLYEPFLRMRTQGSFAFGGPIAQPSDRRGGANWPIWRQETELNRFRQDSRVLVKSNSYAKGLLRNMTNYVIGKGFTYKAGVNESTLEAEEVTLDQATVEKLAKKVQAWMDDFCERNNWNACQEAIDEETGEVVSGGSTRERESYWRVPRDGECFLRLFRREDGKVDVRFVDPELIWGTPPGGNPDNGWSYGIQHKIIKTVDEDGKESQHEDLETIVAYFVRSQGRSNLRDDENDKIGGEIVQAIDIIHIKDPWEDAEVKRGIPQFIFDTLDAFLRAAALQYAISKSAAVRAATAEVWKHNVGTQQQIAGLAGSTGLPTQQVDTPAGGSITMTRMIPGQIRRIPQNQEPVPFSTTTNVPEHQQAAQGDLQQGLSAFSAPQYFAGDASNANYSSTQEAGTPFVRSAEAEQEHYKNAFLKIMSRVIRWAVKCNSLPQEALTHVKLSVEAPLVHKNNEGELAQVMTAELQAKVTSPQIECGKRGNDWKKVQSDWEEFNQTMGQQQGGGQMLGQPSPDAGMQQEGESQDEDTSQEGGEDIDQQAGMIADTLYGLYGDEAKSVVDSKRSLAAKRGWAKRSHGHALSESLDISESLEAELLEAGFTGEITDKRGRKILYREGKRVKRGGEKTPEEKVKEGEQPKRGRAKKGTPESIAAAKEAVAGVLSGKAKIPADDMVGHLANLTVKDLQALHKEHGVKAPGRLRAQLIESVKARLLADESGQKNTEQENKEPNDAFDNLSSGMTPKPSAPKEPDREYSTPSLLEHHSEARQKAFVAIKQTQLSREKKIQYAKNLDAVIGNMTPKAVQRANENISGHVFHDSLEKLTDTIAAKSGTLAELKKKGKLAGGAYAPKSGKIHLDGGGKDGGRGYYAHEYGHAIDGKIGSRISETPDWHEAWGSELKTGGNLSNYAGHSPAEGFAEFSRLVYAEPNGKQTAQEKFPKCFAIWQKEGLI